MFFEIPPDLSSSSIFKFCPLCCLTFQISPQICYYDNFQSAGTLKGFYTKLPYAHHLYSTVNILLYLLYHICIIYPPMHPSVQLSYVHIKVSCYPKSFHLVFIFDSFIFHFSKIHLFLFHIYLVISGVS